MTRASSRILFITGTDTGVGKTVFASDLTSRLRASGVRVAALKPVCSGGRSDARMLRKAAGNILPLDAVNPWHFRAAIAPVLAARGERKRVRLSEVVRHIHGVSARFQITIVEGAGGLLSPLGEDFDSRDLIVALKAEVVVLCPNKIGAIGQTRLVLQALPKSSLKHTRVVLVNQPRSDRAARTNCRLLAGYFSREQIYEMQWLRARR